MDNTRNYAINVYNDIRKGPVLLQLRPFINCACYLSTILNGWNQRVPEYKEGAPMHMILSEPHCESGIKLHLENKDCGLCFTKNLVFCIWNAFSRSWPGTSQSSSLNELHSMHMQGFTWRIWAHFQSLTSAPFLPRVKGYGLIWHGWEEIMRIKKCSWFFAIAIL